MIHLTILKLNLIKLFKKSAKPSLDPIVSFKRKNANNENEPSKQVKQEDNLTSEEK